MRTLKTIQKVLFVAGISLLSFSVLVYIEGVFQARVALVNFNRELAQPAPGSQNVPAVNVESSTGRIRSYEHRLARHVETPLGILRISRINLEAPVSDGTDRLTLNRGLGWIKGTAQLGEYGNVGIAGHRDTFLRSLKGIRPADEVELVTQSGTYTYVVESLQVVDPEDTSVLTNRGGHTLTLVTCYPFHFVGPAPKRFIVHASMQTASAEAVSRPDQVSSTDMNENLQEKRR